MEIKDLRNGIFALFSDNLTCIKAWGVYLTDSKFDDEPELRNKLSVIWLASLFDSLEGEARVLQKYKKAAQDFDQPKLIALCDIVTDFMDIIREVLILYSREEQLFIRDLRDQWVHSWLARRHNESFAIKYYNGTNVVMETVTRVAYYDSIRPFFEHPGGIDASLIPLIERILKNPLRYWNAVKQLNQQITLIHQVIMYDVDAEIIWTAL